MTFSDEFNGSSLDTAKWATEYGFDTGCVVADPPPPGTQTYCNRSNNNEKEWYIDEAQVVSGGTLKLVATINDCSGDNLPDRGYAPYTCENFPYLSGMISTHGGFSQKYGYFEARIKVPSGQGFWPAFWTLPQLPPPGSPVVGYWPPEVDIMEFKGQQPNDIFMTNIWSGFYPDPGTDMKECPTCGYSQTNYTAGVDFSAGFHTFAIDWEPDTIVWYIDGVERARETQFLPPGRIDPPSFTGQMHVILNLAAGGSFVGNLTPPDAALPAQMEVDYVRVYQKIGGAVFLPAVISGAP
jgi:beta-glucanase (GH16 family)